jgi:hypothetical protein
MLLRAFEQVGRPPVENSALAQPVTSELEAVALEVPGRDDETGVGFDQYGLDELQGEIRDHDLALRQRLSRQVEPSHVDTDVVRGRIPRRRVDRGRIDVERDDRRVAEAHGRDRDHAGAATGIEHARRRELGDELDAQPCRRVRPGAERATRIDHHWDRAGRRLLPRRPDPEPADQHAAMEVAPPLLPARLDVLDERVRRRLRVRVGDELELRTERTLLETLREALEPLRARLLGARERNPNSDSSQRNALFSFSKKPSSCL